MTLISEGDRPSSAKSRAAVRRRPGFPGSWPVSTGAAGLTLVCRGREARVPDLRRGRGSAAFGASAAARVATAGRTAAAASGAGSCGEVTPGSGVAWPLSGAISEARNRDSGVSFAVTARLHFRGEFQAYTLVPGLLLVSVAAGGWRN